MPAYSIGNTHQIEVKETYAGEFNKQNLEVLKAVLFCAKNFLYNDVFDVAGRDRFVEGRAIGRLSKTFQTQDVMDQLLQRLSDVSNLKKDSKLGLF